jgi:hypothetical protein
MPRVVPSQVVAFIDTLPNYTLNGNQASLRHLGPAALAGILDLVDQVPGELLTMDGATYALVVLAKANIRVLIDDWNADRHRGLAPAGGDFHLSGDPVRIIRRALSQCPDQSPAPSTAALNSSRRQT